MTTKKRLGLRLPPDVWDALKTEADARGETIATYTQNLLTARHNGRKK